MGKVRRVLSACLVRQASNPYNTVYDNLISSRIGKQCEERWVGGVLTGKNTSRLECIKRGNMAGTGLQQFLEARFTFLFDFRFFYSITYFSFTGGWYFAEMVFVALHAFKLLLD